MSQAGIEIIRNGFILETRGLAKCSHPELRVSIKNPTLTEEGEAFLSFVTGYLAQSKTRIKPGETLTYGYWLVKFEIGDDGVLEVFEYNADATSFIKGAELTLTYWRDQHAICDQIGANFDPPRPDRKLQSLMACTRATP